MVSRAGGRGKERVLGRGKAEKTGEAGTSTFDQKFEENSVKRQKAKSRASRFNEYAFSLKFIKTKSYFK